MNELSRLNFALAARWSSDWFGQYRDWLFMNRGMPPGGSNGLMAKELGTHKNCISRWANKTDPPTHLGARGIFLHWAREHLIASDVRARLIAGEDMPDFKGLPPPPESDFDPSEPVRE